jgi:hypothetical protein
MSGLQGHHTIKNAAAVIQHRTQMTLPTASNAEHEKKRSQEIRAIVLEGNCLKSCARHFEHCQTYPKH